MPVPLLALHILAGTLALLAGATAMAAAKGGVLHRRCGTVFSCTMLTRGATGAWIAWQIDKPLSVIAGVLVIYLVSSAWLTVCRPVSDSRWRVAGLML